MPRSTYRVTTVASRGSLRPETALTQNRAWGGGAVWGRLIQEAWGQAPILNFNDTLGGSEAGGL